MDGLSVKKYLQISWHFCRKCLCIICNCMMQVNSGCMLQKLCLVHNCIHYIRMTMTTRDNHDATKSIQVIAPRFPYRFYIFSSTMFTGFLQQKMLGLRNSFLFAIWRWSCVRLGCSDPRIGCEVGDLRRQKMKHAQRDLHKEYLLFILHPDSKYRCIFLFLQQILMLFHRRESKIPLFLSSFSFVTVNFFF